jgi:hypothetical protein
MDEKFVYTVREITRFSEMLLYAMRFVIDTVEKVAKKLLYMAMVWFYKENLTVKKVKTCIYSRYWRR